LICKAVEEEGIINSCTKDGSVDFYGNPALKNSSGRWRSATLLLGIYPHTLFYIFDLSMFFRLRVCLD